MKRSAVIIAVAVLSLAASSAGADVAPPACGPSNCKGCCKRDECITTLAPYNCGLNGVVCAICESGQVCNSAGVCAASAGDGGSTPTADGAVTPPTKEDSGCALGGRGAARAVGPWLFCGSLAALLLLAGRRRRR